MRVLVAGGAGFIGSHVCDALIDAGHDVICLDNLSTGRPENIEPLTDHPRFAFLEGDVIEPPNLEVDLVLHLASPASPVHYRANPLETMLANSLGTLKLLRLATANRAGFLFASTSEVYGDPLEHPQRECYWGNVNQTGERACYDESKRFGETLTLEFARRGLNAAIVRIFNTYGPRMQRRDGRVVPEFLEAALDKRPFPVQGDGLQTRSFCYVSDLVAGILKVAFSSGPSGRIYNLGNPEEVTMLELGGRIAETLGIEPRYEFLPAAADDPARRCPDITRISQALGWQPRTPLAQGLVFTATYFQSLREVARA
jgi:nucleoside-diphosphate-sugar epimerase